MVTLDAKDFSDAVSVAKRGVAARSSLPILGHLRLRSQGHGLQVDATNLEIGVRVFVPQAKGNGLDTCVDAKALTKLPKVGTLKLSQEGHNGECGKLVIENGSFRASLMTLPGLEFPEMPVVTASERAVLTREDIEELAALVPFVSEDGSREILTGVFLDSDQAVSTDSHRLATVELSVDTRSQAVIPGYAVSTLNKILPKNCEEVKLYECETRGGVCFEWTTGRFFSRVIEGQYPAWHEIVDPLPGRANASIFDCKAADMLAALAAVKPAADENSEHCVIATEKDEFFRMLVRAWSGNYGQLQYSIPYYSHNTGEPAVVHEQAFNCRYLAEGIKYASGDVAIFQQGPGETDPLMLRWGKRCYVLMPKQLDSVSPVNIDG